jgi:hypothetical protein
MSDACLQEPPAIDVVSAIWTDDLARPSRERLLVLIFDDTRPAPVTHLEDHQPMRSSGGNER